MTDKHLARMLRESGLQKTAGEAAAFLHMLKGGLLAGPAKGITEKLTEGFGKKLLSKEKVGRAIKTIAKKLGKSEAGAEKLLSSIRKSVPWGVARGASTALSSAIYAIGNLAAMKAMRSKMKKKEKK